jgi:small subunit ribosomal protein S4e
MVLRDLLKVVETAAEAKKALSAKHVLVDGKVVTEEKFPVGLMDVISLPVLGKHYRMLLDSHGRFILVEVTEERAQWKLCRIENKTCVPGGRLQLNLHDGRNILVDDDVYKTGDVLKIELPTQRIIEAFKLVQGNMALVVSGSSAGQIFVVEEQVEERFSAPNLIRFKNGKLTIKDGVFVIGNKTPEIVLPEVRAV